MEIKDILHKSPSKRLFTCRHRIHSLLLRADARGSADVHHLPYLTHITSLRVRHGYWGHKSRSRIEYLIPSNNIIVLDLYFNLITNLISLAGFNTILWSLGSGLLFESPYKLPCMNQTSWNEVAGGSKSNWKWTRWVEMSRVTRTCFSDKRDGAK